MGWIATSALAIREIDRLRRTQERSAAAWAVERRDLVDRVMYMADKPWLLPQAETTPVESEPDYVDDALDSPIPVMDFSDIEPSGRV